MQSNISSILAADFGSANTGSALIELVDGHYQLAAVGLAPSTYGEPWRDITVGLHHAVRQIETQTGRTLLAPGGWPITPRQGATQGVDAFVVVSSAGPPLSVALAGLMHNISLTSARRAAATTYAHISTELALDNESGGSRRTVESQIQTIQAETPDVILLVGGTDGGAERPVVEMANVVLMALSILNGANIPDVLFAGNQDARQLVTEIIGDAARLVTVDNVRPSLDVENLMAARVELENLYRQKKMLHLPGFDKLKQWTQSAPMPASQSFEKAITYLGQHNQLNVLGVNVGSGATMVAAQAQDYQGLTIRSDAGVGHSLASLVNNVPMQKIRRWLPFDISPADLRNHLLNKALYPANIPTTTKNLMIEYAVAREALRLTLTQMRAGWPLQPSTGHHDIRWNLVIGGGQPLIHTAQLYHAAMILLDVVEPWGVTTLMLDKHHLINMLGAIAAVQPVAAVEVITNDMFINLGSVIGLAGHGVVGQTAATIKIDRGNDVSEEIEIPYGSIRLIDVPPGQKITLEINPARHFDIGLRQPGRSAVAEVEGGVLGVIIDARGRPLKLSKNDDRRYEQLNQWSDALSGNMSV